MYMLMFFGATKPGKPRVFAHIVPRALHLSLFGPVPFLSLPCLTAIQREGQACPNAPMVDVALHTYGHCNGLGGYHGAVGIAGNFRIVPECYRLAAV